MANPKRMLSESQEELYKVFVESNGKKFVKNKKRRYRISDDVFQKISNEKVFEIPEGQHIKGQSTLYDADGKKIMEWVKTSNDNFQKENIIQSIVDGMSDKIEKVDPSYFDPVKLNSLDDSIINQYTVTDYHLGLMAWGEETKDDDWNLKIAEELLTSWFEKAIQLSPNSEDCIFAQIGDFLHWDGLDAVTPTSRNLLDADTRFTKLVRVALRVLRKAIDMLLSKHNRVFIVMAEGNHDLASSIWLKETFSLYYENEPRVIVDTNPDPYYSFLFGKTLLFYNHGHLKKFSALDSVFVSKFKKEFGVAKNVYAHTGHLHHNELKETALMIIEQHRTLAAKDSHASRHGYSSGRDAKVITYHKEYGEVARQTINVDIIKDSVK